MKKLLPLLLVTVLTLFLACNKENPIEAEDLRGTLSGTVTDQFANPISGVSVTGDIEGFNSNTLENGTYSIPDVEPGSYSFVFSKAGYFDSTMDTSIAIAKLDEVVNIDMVLFKITGSVNGTITDGHGNVLEGATIQANSDTVSREISSDSVGNYLLSSLPLGIYSITVSKDIYTTETSLCTLSVITYEDTMNASIEKTVSTLNGVVVDSIDEVRSGVTVTLTSTDSAPTVSNGLSAITNAEGLFEFEEVVHGTYIVDFYPK